MRMGEIAGRTRQELSKQADRFAFASRFSRDRRAPRSLAAPTPECFFASLTQKGTAKALADRFPDSRDQIVAAADDICRGNFHVFGHKKLSFGDPIDWHLDPLTGQRAPLVHWSRINPLDLGGADSKVIWELNRHQWLATLGQAYWFTGQQRFAERAADLLNQWCQANPYGLGINWNSSLEVGYRLISFCWALALLKDAPGFSPSESFHHSAFVVSHARHVERYLSYFFSPNTHLTGEALGLFYAGLVFPQLPRAARWRELGKRILINESRRQILDDGVYFEQSTCYQRYTIDIYLHFLILASRNGINVPADIAERVARLVEFLLAVSHRDGAMPQIGDADGGWLLPLASREPNDCRGVFAAAGAWFGRPDFAQAANGLAPEVVWLLGIDGATRFDALSPSEPRGPVSPSFPTGGYVVMRTGWQRNAHRLIVDVGPLGCPISAAHGHADLLSLQCSAFGEDYLVDPGTFCYATQPAWRDYFRGSFAHSTVTLDGLSQSQTAGTFGWRTRPAVTLRTWRSTDQFDFVDAQHDAYMALSDPVVHRRRVLFVKPRFWVVVDDLAGKDLHRIDVRFQFAPISVTLAADPWVSARGGAGTELWVGSFSTVPLDASIREGTKAPIEGWVSSDYGQRRPAPVLVYTATAVLPARIVTLLVPVERPMDGPPTTDVVRNADGELAALTLKSFQETVTFDARALLVTRGGTVSCAAS